MRGGFLARPRAGFSPGVAGDFGFAADTDQQKLGRGENSRAGVKQVAAFGAGEFTFLNARAQVGL